MMKRLLAVIAFLCLPTAVHGQALVLDFPLQDNLASTVVDAVVGTDGVWVGAGNTSASSGTPGPTTPLPRYLTFDGTNDRVTASTGNVAIIKNKAAVTVTCWFKTTAGDTTGTHTLVFASVNGSGNTRAGLFLDTNGKVFCYARAGDGESVQSKTTTSGYDDNNWHHAAAVIDYAADTITLYVDGTSVAQSGTIAFTGTATANTNSTNVMVGGGVSSDWFKGQLAGARFYDYALNEAAIDAIIAEGATTPVITTSDTQSLEESERLVCELTATDGTEPYVWTVTGGADAALFSVVDVGGDPWLHLDGSADFENPDDADTNGVYVVEVTCTDDDTETDALTINVTVTDEGGAGTGFSAGVNNGPIR